MLKNLNQIIGTRATDQRREEAGFSLLELLIVIVIIGIISGIGIIGYSAVTKNVKNKLAQTRLSVFAEAQSRFRLSMGRGRYAGVCELARTNSNTGEPLIPETIAKFDSGCNPVAIGDWSVVDDVGSSTGTSSLRTRFLIKLKNIEPADGRNEFYCIAEDGVLRKDLGGECSRTSTPVE